jgi:hypothetical protein
MTQRLLKRNVSRCITSNIWNMLNTLWAVVHEGRIKTVGEIHAPEGTRALVTVLVDVDVDVDSKEESTFWQEASSVSLPEIWNNSEDDVYGELLKA